MSGQLTVGLSDDLVEQIAQRAAELVATDPPSPRASSTWLAQRGIWPARSRGSIRWSAPAASHSTRTAAGLCSIVESCASTCATADRNGHEATRSDPSQPLLQA